MTPNTPFERVIGLMAGICVGTAGVIAFLVLLSWATGQWMMGTLGYGYVPMAPGTASAVLLLSFSLFASIHRPARALSIWMCRFSAALTGIICAVAMNFLAFGPDRLFDRWLVPIGARVADQPVGVMSPVTALVLLLCAAALALESPPAGHRRANRQIASAFAFVGGLISLWVILGYALGVPVLYGTKMVPMALSSGIAMTLLSAGLIYHAAPGVWPISSILPDHSGEPSKWTAKGPVVAFLLLFAAVAVVGGIQLEMQQANMRRAALAELEAVADLKTQDIARWRQERLADAHFFACAAFVSRDVQALLADPNSETIRADVLNWLTLLKGGDRYSRISIFDAAGGVLLSLPQQTDSPGDKVKAFAADTVKKNAVSMLDLHEGKINGAHLDLMVPVHAPGAGPAATPIAAIGLRMDPQRFLFPLIQSWPSPSATAETLIVRREGNEVVYLSELRHQKGSSLKLHLPLGQSDLPAAMAIQGKTGLVEGVDYRGAPVVAALRQVPDSPWSLVAKVDQAEIYAASRTQALHGAAMMALLILAAGLGIVALWRQRNLEYFRASLAQETRQGILTQRFEHLMRQANDLILLTDRDGKIIEANDRAVQAYGRSLAELRNTGLINLRAPEARALFDRQMAELAENGSIRFETMHQRADGAAFPVEISARLVDIGGAEHCLHIVRDITERREREREIERLNRLYAALSQVNQAIVRSRTQSEMLDSVCAALVEHGCLQLAWVGRHNPQDQSVNPCTGRGPDGAAFSKAVFFTDSRAEGQGPTVGPAVRGNCPVVCLDLAAAPCSPEVRLEIDRMGICASAALPIHLGGQLWGVLAVGARDAGYFGDREMALLEEAASDVSFALDHLAVETERRRAEDQLRETQQRLALAVEGARLGLWDWNLRTNAVHFSHEYKRQLGYEDGDFSEAFAHWEENLHPDDREWTLATVDEFIKERGEYQEIEFRLKHRDGSYRWMLSRTMLRCGPDGAPELMIGCHIDITDRKLSEEALRRSEENLVLAERIAHVGYWERALDGVSILWSDEAYRVFGLAPQERPINLPSFLAMVHPEDREAVSEAIRATREEDKPYNIEYRIVRPDGATRHVHSQGELFLDALGRPDRVFGTMLDITERRKAEETLRESEQRFRLIAENTGDVIWRLDAATRRFTYISSSVQRLRGFTAAEAMAQDIRQALTPESYERLNRHLLERAAAFKAGDESARIMTQEVEQPHKDGRILTTEVVSTLLADEHRNIIEILGITRDITARKRAESALRESEQRFRIIAENTGDVIWQLDIPALKFTYVSPSVMRLRGYTPEEVMVQPLDEALTPDSFRLVAEGIAAHMAEPEGSTELRKLRTSVVKQPCKDGSVVTTEVVTTALTDDHGRVTGVLGVTRDITERVRAEEELRKSEERFRAAFEDGLFGMALVSPDGHFLEVNPALCQMLGYSEDEMRKRTFADITHSKDRAASVAAVKGLLSGVADTFELEKRYLDKQGRTVWGMVRARVLRNPDGTPRLLLAQVLDTTERKKAEQEILANQDRLKRAQAVGHVGSWEYELKTRTIWGSEEACRILGLSPDEGVLMIDMVEARIQDWDQARQVMLGQLNERSAYDVELAINPIDGAPRRILRVVAELMRDDRGQPTRIVGVAEDVTDQKRTAEELRETQERLRLALDSSGVGTFDWIIAEGKHVLDAHARHLFGMDPGNGSGSDAGMAERFMAAVHPEDRDRVSAELADAVQKRSEIEAECRMIWPDGSIHDISARGKVHRDASGRALRLTGVCWDITARKEAESILKAYSEKLGQVIEERTRQLREAQDELVRKGKLAVLGQLAGGVGHELRNPLGVISNAVYYLKLVNDGADETSKEYLNIISTEVRNCQKIITDLLGFARTGRADRSAVALPMLVSEVLAQISPARDVEVVLDIPEDLPLLSVDPGQVRQVLYNLMLNACQAMQDGGVLTVGGRQQDDRVRVSITDTGCGMSEEELSRIFEPLYSTKARGIGLGLSVTKNLIEANSGSIGVESITGKGSTFTVVLPAQE